MRRLPYILILLMALPPQLLIAERLHYTPKQSLWSLVKAELHAMFFVPQTWYIRTGGGTRQQCTGTSDTDYPGSGTGQACGFNDFRYLWSPNDGTGGAGTWIIAGGDTVVIRGCTALASQVNPSNPDCRIGYDTGLNGNPPNSWCPGIGNQDCLNPPIPAGTFGQHTKILGTCAFGTYTCTPIDYAHWPYTGNNLAKLFCGFGLTRGCFNLKSTSFVDVIGIELTTHNAVSSGNPGFPGNCTFGGAPAFPVSCANNQPLDDYAQNGFVTDIATLGVTLQDVNIHGFNASALWGPIGGVFTMTRVNASFNGFAGWNFQNQSDDPNASGSQILASNVTMNGNGCYEKYPLTAPNLLWPARACYDDLSGGFGDAWSGQDTTLDVFTCDHCVMLYNTKDAFIGPHAQVGALTVTNTVSIGNEGAQMKYGSEIGANVSFQNDIFVMNCGRQSELLPNAVQNFALTTGLGGSYLSDFCRAGGDGWAFLTRATSTNHFYGITLIGANATMMDINCGFVDSGGVHEETNCNTSPLIWRDLNVLGYTPPFVGAQPGLWFFDPGAGGSLVLTADHNNYFGVRNISPDVCGTNNITCVDPKLTAQPSQTWVSEATLDVFNPFAGTGNSFYPTGISPLLGAGATIGGLTTDYYARPRPSPPSEGAVELNTVPVPPIILGGKIICSGKCTF